MKTIVTIFLGVFAFGIETRARAEEVPNTNEGPRDERSQRDEKPTQDPATCIGDPNVSSDTQLSLGQQFCSTSDGQKDGNCNSADLNEKGSTTQKISAGIYGAASVVCGAQCIGFVFSAGGTGCSIMSIGAGMADIGFAGYLAIEAANKQENTAEGAVPAGVAGGQAALQAVGMFAGESSPLEAFKSDADAKEVEGFACKAFWLNGIQSGMHFLGNIATQSSADSQYRKAYLAHACSQKGTLVSTGSSKQGLEIKPDVTSSPPSAGTQVQNSGEVEDKKKISAKQAEQVARAAGQGPLLDDFEKVTGKPASELFDRILNGTPPAAAAAQLAAGALGPSGVAELAKIQSVTNQLSDEDREKLLAADKQSGISQRVFESASAGGGSRSPSGGASTLPDFHSLFASMMPKKGDEKGGSASASKTSLALALRAQAEGLHPPTKSIFDIVGARYALVTKQFLAGKNVLSSQARTPVSVLPKNIYLGR